MKRNTRGFTLVEILIVVIILGILAAIVIPQFTSASNNARQSSIQSTLQTVRSQIELFKIQHNDTPPAAASMWSWMLAASNTTYPLGPYIQAAPVNPCNGNTAVGAAAATTIGWVYTVTGTGYTLSAVDTTGANLLTY